MLTYILSVVELNKRASQLKRKSLDEKISWFNAIKNNNLVVVQDFIKNDFDMEVTNEKGNTALHIASKEGYFDTETSCQYPSPK